MIGSLCACSTSSLSTNLSTIELISMEILYNQQDSVIKCAIIIRIKDVDS